MNSGLGSQADRRHVLCQEASQCQQLDGSNREQGLPVAASKLSAADKGGCEGSWKRIAVQEGRSRATLEQAREAAACKKLLLLHLGTGTRLGHDLAGRQASVRAIKQIGLRFGELELSGGGLL